MSALEQLEIPMPEARGKRVAQVLELADFRGRHGTTVKEVREFYGLHHGSASSALSVLDSEGRLVRLAEKRDRCSVYVVPSEVAGRPVAPVRGHKGPTEDDVTSAFQRGRRNAREDALRDVGLFTKRIREAVMLGRNIAKRHDAQCYKEHPECALKAVLMFIDGSIGAEATDAQQEAARTAE